VKRNFFLPSFFLSFSFFPLFLIFFLLWACREIEEISEEIERDCYATVLRLREELLGSFQGLLKGIPQSLLPRALASYSAPDSPLTMQSEELWKLVDGSLLLGRVARTLFFHSGYLKKILSGNFRGGFGGTAISYKTLLKPKEGE
jgi:hypothetical protein